MRAALPPVALACPAAAETKRYLRESVVWPFNHPELFGDAAVSATLGVLLFGPPGTPLLDGSPPNSQMLPLPPMFCACSSARFEPPNIRGP